MKDGMCTLSLQLTHRMGHAPSQTGNASIRCAECNCPRPASVDRLLYLTDEQAKLDKANVRQAERFFVSLTKKLEFSLVEAYNLVWAMDIQLSDHRFRLPLAVD